MINPSNDALHYLRLGQLLYILVFPFHMGVGQYDLPYMRGKVYIRTHNNLLLYFVVEFRNAQKKSVKI